jgi:hypothetical protein
MRALRLAGGIRPGYAAAVLAFAADGLYLAVIAHQDTGITGRVVFVAASLAGAGAVAATAELLAGRAAGVAAAWAAATLCIWTLLGVFSIGLAVAPAGAFAVVALNRRRDPAFVVAAGIVAAALTAVAGLAWTPA